MRNGEKAKGLATDDTERIDFHGSEGKRRETEQGIAECEMRNGEKAKGLATDDTETIDARGSEKCGMGEKAKGLATDDTERIGFHGSEGKRRETEQGIAECEMRNAESEKGERVGHGLHGKNRSRFAGLIRGGEKRKADRCKSAGANGRLDRGAGKKKPAVTGGPFLLKFGWIRNPSRLRHRASAE